MSLSTRIYTVFHKKTNLTVFLITRLSLTQFQSNIKHRQGKDSVRESNKKLDISELTLSTGDVIFMTSMFA